MTDHERGNGWLDWMTQQVRAKRSGLQEWRSQRPFAGGVCLILAGLVVGYIPVQFAGSLFLLGNASTMLGVIFAVLILMCGVTAIRTPEYADLAGTAGVVFSVLSIFGALGGFGIGLVLGVIGGNLTASWEPAEPNRPTHRPAEEPAR
jgi:hypothetical protein